MLKKILTFLSVSLLSFSSVVLADYQYATQRFNHAFVDLGVSAYYLNNHVFDVGTVGSTSSVPLAKVTNNGYTPRYHLGIGYQFLNCSDTLFTRLFGNENTIEFKMDYLNRDRTVHKDSLGTGNVWLITGANQTLVSGTQIYAFQLRAQHRKTDMGLYYQTHRYTTNPNLTLSPYAGVVYSNYHELYSYHVAYNGGSFTGYDSERFNVKTRYYGLALGNRISYAVTKQLGSYVDLEAQLLHANAELTAEQQGYGANGTTLFTAVVRNNDHRSLTYRAILALGVDYRFSQNPDATVLSLEGGVDRWGYSPVVVTPNGNNTSAVYLDHETQNNMFAKLNLRVPIPGT